MKTYVATPTDRQRDWYVIDAEGKTLGRLATQIADMLRGKRKPEYTPHCDTGDFVIVVNAEKIAVTGNKRTDKIYYRHSGYPGGIKSRTLGEMLERRPEEVIRKAVNGMLPRNRLARQQITKLKVYAGPEHPHAAQKPKPMETKGATKNELTKLRISPRRRSHRPTTPSGPSPAPNQLLKPRRRSRRPRLTRRRLPPRTRRRPPRSLRRKRLRPSPRSPRPRTKLPEPISSPSS